MGGLEVKHQFEVRNAGNDIMAKEIATQAYNEEEIKKMMENPRYLCNDILTMLP